MLYRIFRGVPFFLSIFCVYQAVAQTASETPVSFICVEPESGIVLMEENADLQRPPASMLKMMLFLLVEEGMQAGNWNYDRQIQISARAQGMGGTQVYLAQGESWPLKTLVEAMAVASANDASVAVAEGLWGSVEECLKAMNKRAAELGMTKTTFYSVNGLPPDDGKTFDQTSARDMATLGCELLKHPNILTFTGMKEFALRPENTAKTNTNKLLETMPGCDGLKTGYIRAAGFCLTATAKRDDIRLLAVVMGSDRTGRFTHTQKILEDGFKLVQRVAPVKAGTRIGKPVAVVKGLAPEVSLKADNDINMVVRKTDLDKLVLEVTAPTALEAPVVAEKEVGHVRVMLDDKVFGKVALVTAQAVERKLFRHRFREMIGLDP